MSDYLYFNKYYDRDSIFKDKLFEIKVILHDKNKTDDTYILTPKSFQIDTSTDNIVDKFQIIHDEYSFFNVEGAGNRINLFETFKTSKNFAEFFYKNDVNYKSSDLIEKLNKRNKIAKSTLLTKYINDVKQLTELSNLKNIKDMKSIFLYYLKNAKGNDNSNDNSNDNDFLKALMSKNISLYMLLLYSFVRAFYSLELKQFKTTKEDQVEPYDNIIAKEIFGLQIANYSNANVYPLNPKTLKQKTEESIQKNDKPKFYDEEEDSIIDAADLITISNIYKLLTYSLKKGDIINLENTSTNEKLFSDYEILEGIKPNDLYKKLFRVNTGSRTIIVHFDITLKKVSNIENLNIIIDLHGDINEKNVKYLPKYTDPKYSKYEKIFITSENLFRDRFLNLSKFKPITDKNEFFFNDEYFNLLNKEMKQSADKSVATAEEKHKNIKSNMDFIIKRLFKSSYTIKPKNRGYLEYKGRQYMINGYADDIEYVHGGDPGLTPQQKYKNVIVDLSDVRIDFNDYYTIVIKDNKSNPKYEIMDNIFIQNRSKLIPLKSSNITNIDINTGHIYYKEEKKEEKVNKIAIKNLIIMGSRKNIKSLSDNDITNVFYEGKKMKFISNDTNDTNKITLLDESVQTMVLKTGINKTYTIRVPLLLLDKLLFDKSDPLEKYRRLMKKDCDGSTKKIDNILTNIFFPLGVGNNKKIQFFHNILTMKDRFDKYGDIAALVKKNNPVSKDEISKKKTGGTKKILRKSKSKSKSKRSLKKTKTKTRKSYRKKL